MNKKKVVLELFAWTRSIWKEADKLWYEVHSLEFEEKFGCEMTMDILDFNPEDYDFIPDAIWASPPCTTYSVASLWRHRYGWKDLTDWHVKCDPKTESAKHWDKMVKKTIAVIEYYLKKNPNLVFFIENPRAMLRKMPFMLEFLERVNWVIQTVTYCQYWYAYMKPTDIFTNSKTWVPRPHCKNWDPCHISAPRWSRTWTQGVKWSELRAVIPPQLCKEVMQSI